MMKKYLLYAIVACTVSLISCTEDIDTADRFLFKEDTVISYLEKYDQYSEYLKLLNQVSVIENGETSVYQLLLARGHYTIFAPTNEAIQEYLNTLVQKGIITEASWDAFPSQKKLDSIQQIIVLNSIIDSGDNTEPYEIDDFPPPTATSNEVDIPLPNMNDRKLIVQYSDEPGIIHISDCRIDEINRDILCTNGIIHAMHSVVAPSNNTMNLVMQKYIEDENSNFVISSKIAYECGLFETLSAVRDETYETMFKQSDERIPKFMESIGDNGP